MSNYCHTRTFEVRYSDVDFKDELKPSAMLAFAQEAACTSGDELGFGYSVLKPLEIGFMIISTCCEVIKPVCLGEKITVQTWPLPPRHCIFERDYRILNERGEVAVNIASRWCLVDLKNMGLLSPDSLSAHATCPYNGEKSFSPVWKIQKLNGEGETCGSVKATNSLCDHYLHINNTRYADLFFDCFTMDELQKRRIKAFSLTYNRQIREGSELCFYKKQEGDSCRLEAHCDGQLSTQFSVTFA